MHGHHIIDGRPARGSGAPFTAEDPVTGGVNWEGHAASAEDVDTALSAARRAQPGWAEWSRVERRGLVLAYKAVLEEQRDRLVSAIVADTGKPRWEAATEAAAMIAKVDISIRAEDDRCPERAADTGPHRAVLRHKPHGVCAVFGPYNFPGHLANGHIVPALLAGNAVVFKPSELTPLTAEAMVDCWREAGLPGGVLNLVHGGRETGVALASHAGLDGLFFTGSAATGKALARQLVDRPGVILALEMGGNNPLVAWRPQEVEAAARLVVQSAFLTAGQRCTCARRLIVPDDDHGAALLDAVCDLTDRLIVGPPDADPEPFMGPVITNGAAQGVEAAEQALLRQGTKSLRRLTRPVDGRPFLTPGILDVTDAAERPDEEVFGPLLQVVRVPDFDAALAEANATRFGLAAGLVAGDPALWETFLTRSRAGVVNWNRPLTGASSALPFGGIGDSGNHRPSAYYAADYCSWPVASLEADGIADIPQPKGVRP